MLTSRIEIQQFGLPYTARSEGNRGLTKAVCTCGNWTSRRTSTSFQSPLVPAPPPLKNSGCNGRVASCSSSTAECGHDLRTGSTASRIHWHNRGRKGRVSSAFTPSAFLCHSVIHGHWIKQWMVTIEAGEVFKGINFSLALVYTIGS